ncbi:MAG: hypothetical protein GY953_52290 [bacterium]|nr:hypothetical protein [bacterium]
MAVPLLLDLIDRYPRNHLLPVELAHMYADAGDMSNSMGTLDEVEKRIRDGAPGFSHLTVNRVSFLRGHIQFRHHQLAEAVATLAPLLDQQREVEADTRALAGLRLGQTYDLLERRREALATYRVAVLAEPLSDAARLSRRYQLSPYRDKKAAAEKSTE